MIHADSDGLCRISAILIYDPVYYDLRILKKVLADIHSKTRQKVYPYNIRIFDMDLTLSHLQLVFNQFVVYSLFTGKLGVGA